MARHAVKRKAARKPSIRLIVATILLVVVSGFSVFAYRTKGELWDFLTAQEIENINYNVGMLLRQNAWLRQQLAERSGS